jgi:PAS domain S-box-containing protein
MRSSPELIALLESNPAGVLSLATDGAVLSMNSAGLRMLEAESIGDVQNQDFHSFVIAEDRVVWHEFRGKINRGEPGVVEVQVTGLRRTRRYLEILASPLRDEAGQVTAFLGILRDVSAVKLGEPKRAAEALARTETNLRSEAAFSQLLFDTSPAFIVAISAAGRTLMMNRSLLEALEFTAAEIEGADYVSTFVPESERDLLPEFFRQVVQEDRAVVHENRIQSKSGRVYLVEWHGRRAVHNLGTVALIVAIGINITERRQMEVALRRSEETYRGIFNATSDALFIHDVSGAIHDVNQRACHLLGVSRWEALAATIGDISAGEPPYSTDDALKKLRVAEREGPQVFEWHCRRRNGELFWAEVALQAGHIAAEVRVIASVRDITARKQTEAALYNSEKRYRALAEHSLVGVWRITPDGRTEYANPSMLNLLELEQPADLVGRSYLSFFTPESAVVINHEHQLHCKGAASSYEAELVGCRGRKRNVVISGSPLFVDDGKLTSLVATFTDITERKQMDALRQGHLRFLESMDGVNRAIQGANNWEQMMRSVLEVTLAIFNCDRVFLIYPCDPEAATWTVPMECTKPEYPGVFTKKLIVPTDPSTAETFRLLLAAEKPLKFGAGSDHPLPAERMERFGYQCFMAMAILPKVGKQWEFGIQQCAHARIWTPAEERLLLEIGRRLADGLTGLLVLRDLRENESRLAEAERIAHVGYWERDFEADRITISPETRRILGLPPGESVTRLSEWQERWCRLIHPDDRAMANNALAAALRGEQRYDIEYRLQPPGGPLRIVRSHAELARDESGKPRRMFGIVQDITELRLLEERLRQSQKMEAIGQLAGGVAHDYNNILTSTIMQADLGLDDASLTPELYECLKQIRYDADRAANLTRQLLLFSRRQIMQPRDLDLNEVVTNLAKMLQRIIGEDVHLQLRLNSTPLVIHADAGMIDQVLLNLAVNARDAMPEGGSLVIETSAKTMDETFVEAIPDAVPGRYACLGVSDTGCGIPQDVLSRIFEPFFTTKEPGKGTGLGLATVFGIVKQHRGLLKVYSEPAQGTTFQVFVPVNESAVVPDGDRARPKPPGGTETILLVEDEVSVRKTTQIILSRGGYRVLAAANGVAALELWALHRDAVDLLVTDLVMPANMTGMQLARRLLADNPKLKVIFSSGHSAEIAGRQIELRAGDNFLQKPFSPDQLLFIVRRCLDG